MRARVPVGAVLHHDPLPACDAAGQLSACDRGIETWLQAAVNAYNTDLDTCAVCVVPLQCVQTYLDLPHIGIVKTPDVVSSARYGSEVR